MFILSGKPLALDAPFEHEGIKYPSNWLRLASEKEKAKLGVIEIVEQPRPDDRFYYVSSNDDGSYTAIPRELDVLKASMVAQVKTDAGSVLALTDWKVIRAKEVDAAVDQETLDHRAAVRERSNTYEAQINACTSVEELASLTFDWSFE